MLGVQAAWTCTHSDAVQRSTASIVVHNVTTVISPQSVVLAEYNIPQQFRPGAATWFLYAYDKYTPHPSNPEQMLKGWYDIWVPRGDRLVPTGPRFAAMHSDEMRWWVFFKERFMEIRTRTDVGLVAREYAEAAARKMDFLDGSGDKPGFWEGLRQKVGGKKRQGRLEEERAMCTRLT